MLFGECAAEVVQAGQTRHGLVMHPKTDGARAQISQNVFGGLSLRDIGLRSPEARSGCVLRGRLLNDKRLEHVFTMALPDCSFSESRPVAVREGLALPAANSHHVDACSVRTGELRLWSRLLLRLCLRLRSPLSLIGCSCGAHDLCHPFLCE